MRPRVVIPPPESPLSEIILWLFMVCAYGHGLSRRGRNSCLVTFSKGVVTLWVIDWEGGVTLEMETPGRLLGAVEPLSQPNSLHCEATLDPPSAPCPVWSRKLPFPLGSRTRHMMALR